MLRGVGIEVMAIVLTLCSFLGVVTRSLVWCSVGYDEVVLWDIVDGGC